MTSPAVPFSLRDWCAYAPGLDTRAAWTDWAAGLRRAEAEGAPPLGFVDPLLRRRMSRLSRMALHVAHEVLAPGERMRSVFASRHGELQRTTELLKTLAVGEPLSPTAFSLSVHNTGSGLHAIVRGDTSPSTAVAAGRASFTAGLIEALGQVRAGGVPVLLAYADEPLPAVYGEFADGEEWPHALALVLEPGESHCLAPMPDTPAADAVPPALALIHALVTDASEALLADTPVWRWSRA